MSSNAAATSDLDQHIPGAFPNSTPAASSITPQSLYQAVHARRAEYVRPKQIRIKVGTWNVASFKGTEKDVGGWFVHGKGVEEALAGLAVTDPNAPHSEPMPERAVQRKEGVAEQESRSSDKDSTLPKNDSGSLPGGEEIGLYVLGLQEVVDINSAAEALRPYTDPATAAKFKTALEDAMPEGYQLVAEQQLIGLLLLVYASPSVAPEVRSVSTTSVGTGLMGYMGNKGAVTARIVLGETTRLVFINSHLAAGADKTALERRNWDAGQIISRTRFDPIVDSMGVSQANGETIGEEDFAFWFGDLNYRLEGMPGEDVRRILMLHTRNEYDLSQRSAGLIEKDIATSGSGRKSTETTDRTSGPSAESSDNGSSLADPSKFEEDEEEELPAEFDPASLQTTLMSLLPHDELRQQQRQRKAFADWHEGEIQFLPTYKYDVGTVGIFDSSEKRRCPGWCDRILYRTRRDKLAYEAMVKEEGDSKKRDEEMKKQGLESSSDDVLFEYDPAVDGDNEYDEARDAREDPIPVETKDGFEDEIRLEYYTAHQRVLSSDHKPLDAIFMLKYDSIVPELKAKVHQEVARELDRAENEGRPGVTLIVDKDHSKKESSDKDSDFEGVNFGNVKFLESKRRSVTVANTGQVAATISFFGQPGGEQGEVKPPSWLSIRFDREPDKTTDMTAPASYTLEPGDACNIELILKVEDTQLVQGLNEGSAQLEDILVLRVSDGRDHFLPVRASWLQSSFGRSIDKLIRIPEGGIRKLQGQRPSGDSGSSSPVQSKDAGVKWSAPRELFRLTEAIEDLVERVVAEWDMTEHEAGATAPWQAANGGGAKGWPFAPETWRLKDEPTRESIKCDIADALDADLALEAGTAFQPDTAMELRLESLAEMLLIFLRSLTDGVVTEAQWAQLDAGFDEQAKARGAASTSREDERTWILDVMSSAPNHSVCFVLLTSMAARVATEIKTAMKPLKSAAATNRLSRTFAIGRGRSASEVQRAQTDALRRQAVDREMAAALAEPLIRAPPLAAAGKEKDKVVRRQRMCRVVEVFVGDGEGV